MTESLFRQAPISLVQVALDGTILAVNLMVLRVSGYGEHELVGRPFVDFLHPDDRAAAEADLARIARGEAAGYESERRYLLAAGEELFVLERVVVVAPEPPAHPYCLSVLHDLTVRRDLTETLSASEARLRLALEAGRMGTWDWDLERGEAMPSPEMGRLHGVPSEALQGMEAYVSRFVHPDDRERVHRAVADGIATGTGHEVEYRVVWPDGSVRWLLGKGRPFKDASGRPVRVTGICADITTRRQAQHRERLVGEASTVLATVLEPRRALALLADLLVPEFADWCAVDIVTDGEIERVAVAHRDPAKVALALELGRRWPAHVDESTGVAYVVRSRQATRVPRITDEMLTMAARSREHLEVLRSLGLRSAISLPLIARDRVLGVVSLVMAESGRTYDETDQRLAEELVARAATAVDTAMLYQEAQDARRAREDFIARVSHELRTPLHAIAGWTSILRTAADADAVERGLGVIERNVKALTRLIDDLLDFARASRDGLRLELCETDLSQAVAAAVQSLQPVAEQRGVTLAVEAGTPCVLPADAGRLQQVVWNLLSNAIRATPAGGCVTTRVVVTADHAEIRVHDTGEGLSEEELVAIFDPFRRSRRTTGGLGLGLAIARQIVLAHGGRITAHSAGSGTGATFTVILPIRTP